MLRVLFGGEGERKARERAQGNHGKVRKCDGFRTSVCLLLLLKLKLKLKYSRRLTILRRIQIVPFRRVREDEFGFKVAAAGFIEHSGRRRRRRSAHYVPVTIEWNTVRAPEAFRTFREL